MYGILFPYSEHCINLSVWKIRDWGYGNYSQTNFFLQPVVHITRTTVHKKRTKTKQRRETKRMSILTTLRNKIPTLRTTRNTQYTQYLQKRTTTTHEYTETQLRYQAFQNKDIRRCCEVYKNTALTCGYTIDSDTQESDNKITKGYLQRIFENPEGIDGQITWSGINSLIWDSLLVLGDVFFEIATDTKYDVFSGFKYIHNNKIKWSNENDCYQLRDQPDVLFEEDELIHIYRPNPEFKEQHHGVSLVDSCADYIALQNNALRYNNNILTNNGLSPDTILSYDSEVSEANFNAEVQRLQLMKDEADKTGGMLVTRGATFQTASNTNKDMNYLELMKYCRDNIIQNFGVPPQVFGIIESANLGSGSGDSQKKDWKMTFEGEAKFVEDGFNHTLKKQGFSERFHYGLIDIEDELYNAQINQIYLNSGIKTVDEIRNSMGLDRITPKWEGYWR